MSYSFTVAMSTKEAAKEQVAAAFDRVVEGQPIHKADRDAAVAAASAFIDLLGEPNESDEIVVSVNGYLSWHGDMANADFIGATVSVSARVQNKT